MGHFGSRESDTEDWFDQDCILRAAGFELALWRACLNVGDYTPEVHLITATSFWASVIGRSPPSSMSRTSTRSCGFISAKIAQAPWNGPRKILTRSPRRGRTKGHSIAPLRSRKRIHLSPAALGLR